jgi:signal transduction histidine kinase/CheY-like chemotaxis protein
MATRLPLVSKTHRQPDYVHPIPGLITGRPITPPLFPESDCEALRKAIAETFRTEKIQMVIISCRESDGSYRHFDTRISLMDAFFALVILRDVTLEWREREARQQAESRLIKIQKMESLGNLAASIAHDFNNMLAIIQNTLDLTWVQPCPNREEDVAVSTIRQAASKGAALTRELMTYAGQTQPIFKRDDPNTLILELEKLMGGVIAPNIALELKLTPGLPKVDADPHQFWKVIINLLKNASEAINGARGHISIGTYAFTMTETNRDDFFSTQELIPGPGVIFQIDDTGSGIPREMIERLFEPFFSTKSVGRGLGLATVFGIVGSHNGGIAIDSEPGKGSTFRVWLPAIKPGELGRAELEASSSSADRTLSEAQQPRFAAVTKPKPCVLMVEDDQAILQTTRILLRSLGAETLTAASKREALALFRKHAETINLILLDAQIGSLDNVRLLATLRMRKAGIPTIIVSGHTETRIREMFATEPFNGFISKPYTTEDLWSTLSPFITLKKPGSNRLPDA